MGAPLDAPETDYHNAPVTTAQLPDLWTLETEALSPRYRWLNMLIVAGIGCGLLALLSIVRYQTLLSLPANLLATYPFVATAVAVGTVWALTYHFLADPCIRFALREQDLVLHKGLIFKSIGCQPVLRIQHIELKRGPLERLAGLARLQVFSAGGAVHTFEIPGLPVVQAQKLRQFILSHKELNAK